jgi:uncharacterized protein YaiI (UPF0178 family)
MDAPANTIAIYIDADACPVKAGGLQASPSGNRLKVFVVANSFMQVPREPWIERVVVRRQFRCGR